MASADDGVSPREQPPGEAEGLLSVHRDSDLEPETTPTERQTSSGEGSSSGLALAAHRYARLGWHVFPLQPGSKEPVYVKGELENGHLHATAEPEVVERWWERWPSANIALALEPSNLAVIDIDPRYGADRAQLMRICDLGTPLVQYTSGGGEHLIYRDRGVELRGNLKHLGLDGFDVKRKGYIAVAPSLHPSGVHYAWADDDDDDLDVEAMPTPVLDSLRAPSRERIAALRHEGPLDAREQRYVDNAVNGVCQQIASAAEGTRHNTQYAGACRLGELIGGGVLERARAEHRLVLAMTQLYGVAPNRGDLRDMNDGIERGMTNPSGIPDTLTDARNFLIQLADAEHPLLLAELYFENNPEVLAHVPNEALTDLVVTAERNLFARGGEDDIVAFETFVAKS